MSKLDDQIIEEIRMLALTDTQQLIDKYIDINKLKICKQKKMGKTLQAIANAMEMPRSTVQSICKVC
jgi:hypothetical protein